MNKFFSKAGFLSHGVLNLTPEEAFILCRSGACIVDVREPFLNNFRMFSVDNLICLPFSTLPETYLQLPSDLPLIFADSVGLKSRDGAKFMMEHGYENIANLAGGIVDWERDGFPVNTDKTYRLSGSCMCQLKPREGKMK